MEKAEVLQSIALFAAELGFSIEICEETIIIHSGSEIISRKLPEFTKPGPQLQDYVNSPRFHDVVIDTGGREVFYAYKSLLCHESQFFKTMLSNENGHSWKESIPGVRRIDVQIPIHDFDFSLVLEYMYTESVHIPISSDYVNTLKDLFAQAFTADFLLMDQYLNKLVKEIVKLVHDGIATL
jgi:hypothetical protein